MNIDPAIYEVPAVKNSIESIDRRFRQSEGDMVLTLWLRVPWEKGQEPSLFTLDGDDRMQGCVCIYDANDGKLIG